MIHDILRTISTRKVGLLLELLLVTGPILAIMGALHGCARQPRIRYDLAVENITENKLANVRVDVDGAEYGARFGVLVGKGQAILGLFNTEVTEGCSLRYTKEAATSEWFSWSPFTTDELPDGWDGELRVLIKEDVVELLMRPKSSLPKSVIQGTLMKEDL